jgi:hypothetical protein
MTQPCLFGWPDMPWKGQRGRPPHVPDDESRNKIKLLLALGWSNSRIAGAMGISEPTLRRYYLSELKLRAIARDALDARRAEKLWQQVEKGNVGAMKAFDKLLEANDRMRRAADLRQGVDADERENDAPPAPQRKVREQPVGKKELAASAASAAIAADPDLQPGLPLNRIN